MAAEWWWFLVLNAIVATIAVLSKVRPSSPRSSGVTLTRRASSAVLQRLRSSILSIPSAGFHTAPAPLPQPEAAATVSQETEEPAEASPAKPAVSTPRSLARTPPPAPSAKAEEDEEKDDPNAMSMDEAYALIVSAPRRPEFEREEDARRSEVDAKAEESSSRGWFKEDLRQQRLNSIFNYTQMLKKRAFGDGRRQPAAQADQL